MWALYARYPPHRLFQTSGHHKDEESIQIGFRATVSIIEEPEATRRLASFFCEGEGVGAHNLKIFLSSRLAH